MAARTRRWIGGSSWPAFSRRAWPRSTSRSTSSPRAWAMVRGSANAAEVGPPATGREAPAPIGTLHACKSSVSANRSSWPATSTRSACTVCVSVSGDARDRRSARAEAVTTPAWGSCPGRRTRHRLPRRRLRPDVRRGRPRTGRWPPGRPAVPRTASVSRPPCSDLLRLSSPLRASGLDRVVDGDQGAHRLASDQPELRPERLPQRDRTRWHPLRHRRRDRIRSGRSRRTVRTHELLHDEISHGAPP